MQQPAPTKDHLLSRPVEHIDIKRHDPVALVEAMGRMSYSARELSRAASIYERMLRDRDCAVILTLGGSLVSAGLKRVFVDMVRHHMVDAVVATGANVVDQDFFEGLGFRHYLAEDEYKSGLHDQALRELGVDRIYDTFINEQELRECDRTVRRIADSLEPRPYSSREFIREMGAYLDEHAADRESLVLAAYELDVPIFVPAFSDCSAGFGLIGHQAGRHRSGEAMLTLDSARDFYELALVKKHHPTTGLFMLGGGVPKNFAQDVAVAHEVLGPDPEMHKYAVQITVADVRDGALSSSTLKEACSWGKVDTVWEQMVYSEATVAAPLIVGYAYHKGAWRGREAKRCGQVLEPAGRGV